MNVNGETDRDGFSIKRMQCAIYQIYEDSWHIMQALY